jgi:hypothetical protein
MVEFNERMSESGICVFYYYVDYESGNGSANVDDVVNVNDDVVSADHIYPAHSDQNDEAVEEHVDYSEVVQRSCECDSCGRIPNAFPSVLRRHRRFYHN